MMLVETITCMFKLKFETTMLKSSLSDYVDVYTFVKESLTVTGQAAI